jgi:chitinase
LFSVLATSLALAQSPAISIGDVTVGFEGSGGSSVANFTVTLSKRPATTVSVTWSTSDVTARGGGSCGGGNDYITMTAVGLSFFAGDSVETISVPVCGDVIDEDSETFRVNLFSPLNATIADGQGEATLLDDDNPPSVSIADAAIAEGDAGTGALAFTITLSRASGKQVSVNHGTSNSTATGGATCGGTVDYRTTSGSVSFQPGETSKTVSVTICGEAQREPNETFFVNLSNATNASISRSRATGTIRNDDPPLITIDDLSVTEGTISGRPLDPSRSVTMTVRLSVPTTREVSVAFSSANGTAVGGASCFGIRRDYESRSGTLTIPPGATTGTIQLGICVDNTVEPNETFTMSLANAVNGVISDAQATCTITNDD